jgi:hypothetical protein
VCEAIGHDWRVVLRWAEGRPEQPSAAMLDRRTLPSTPESGPPLWGRFFENSEVKTMARHPSLTHTLGRHTPQRVKEGHDVLP